MKNILKLAALIISTTVLSYAADTPDVPPLAGENDQKPMVSFVSVSAQDALNQETLRLSALEERVRNHQELDSNPEDLATLKNDVKDFRLSDTLFDYYQKAHSSQKLVRVLLRIFTDEETGFKNTLPQVGGLFTQEALNPFDPFIHHLDTLKTQTAQFIGDIEVLKKRNLAIQSVFQEKESREISLTELLAFLALSSIIDGDGDENKNENENPFTPTGFTIRVAPMGSWYSSQNKECGNCPTCLLKKERQQTPPHNPKDGEKKSSDDHDSDDAA